MSFDNWQARLRGEEVKTFLRPDAFDEGYYRKPEVERQPNGRWKTLGYVPVAYWMDGNQLVGVIGDRDMTEAEVESEELWSWVCKNAIPHEWYVAVAERGEEWPDKDKWTSVVPPADAAPAAGEQPADPPKPRHVQLSESIAKEIEAAPKTVASAEDDANASGAKNRIADLRLAATREGEAEYKPIYARYKALQERWAAVVKPAADEEKRITKMVLDFREAERKKAVAAAAEAARKQREIDEANARAADRAIANGQPEPAPVVPTPPAPTPAPAPVAPSYGKRRIKEEVKKFAVIEDWAKVFAHFQTDSELRSRLEKLATDAIRAGADVPGATYREGLI